MASGCPTGLGTCSGSILVEGFFDSVRRLDDGDATGAPNFLGVPECALLVPDASSAYPELALLTGPPGV